MNRFLHIGLSCCPNGHGDGMKRYFESIAWEYKDIPVQSPDLNTLIQSVANDYKPTLTWIQIQDRGINKEAIEALKRNNSFVIQWSGDMRNRTPDCYFEYCKMGVDLTCFSNITDVNNVNNCGYNSCFLQIGYDENIYNTTGIVDKQAPIIFMGNSFSQFPLSGLRKDMVRELKRVYGDNFKAFGSGMPDGSKMGDQQGEAAIYRGAKIGINLSHFDSDRYTSDRLFRMIGCGVCVLSHNYKGIEKSFMHGHDLVIWNDINDLKRLINELLIDENTRKKVAAKGHELAVNNFTFEKMGENILSLYNQYNK